MFPSQYYNFGNNYLHQGNADTYGLTTVPHHCRNPYMQPHQYMSPEAAPLQLRHAYGEPTAALTNSDEWKEYDREGNEMLVVNNGRELFPKLAFSVQNLFPFETYYVGLKLRCIEGKSNGRKTKAVTDSNEVFSQFQLGTFWMEHGINLGKSKIYNVGDEKKKAAAYVKRDSEMERKPRKGKTNLDYLMMLQVTSMHKYIPTLFIYHAMQDGSSKCVGHYEFQETRFEVVTKYKKKRILEMKSSNKYTTADVKKKARKVAISEPAVTSESTTPLTSSSNHSSVFPTTYPAPISSPILSISNAPPPNVLFLNLDTVPSGDHHNHLYGPPNF